MGKFATGLAICKHCDTTVSQTKCGRWLLETQTTPKVRIIALFANLGDLQKFFKS